MRLESAGGALVGKDHVAEPIVQDTALHVRVDGQTLIARCALPCLAAAPGSEQVQGRVVIANAGMGLEGATKGRSGLRSRRRRGRGPTGLLVAEEIGEGESLVGVGAAARLSGRSPALVGLTTWPTGVWKENASAHDKVWARRRKAARAAVPRTAAQLILSAFRKGTARVIQDR